MAAEALAEFRDPGAVRPLIRALSDEPEGSAAAAYALGRIGDQQAVPFLASITVQTARFVADDFYQQVNDCVDFVVPPPAWNLHAAAAEALGRIGGSEAVDGLIAALEHGYPASKACTAVLATIGNPKGVAAIIKTLTSGDWNRHLSAKNALDKITEPEAIGPLADALQDTNVEARSRKAIVATVRRIAGPQQIAQIVENLCRMDSDVCRQTAVALERDDTARSVESSAAEKGNDGAPAGTEAVVPLLAALTDREAHVRYEAAKSLAKLADRISDLALLRRVQRALWWRLTDSDARVMYGAFARVVRRSAALEVQLIPFADPLLGLPGIRDSQAAGSVSAL
jgi:HEAT repeat protein